MTVIVNNLTIVNASSNGVALAFPDVCKTPTSGGPVPIPYPNTALSADTSDGSQTVKAEGQPFMLKSSCFSKSTGDAPGSVGGVGSGTTQGKALPKMSSFDVKVEGENVFRNTDLMLQNGGALCTNTPPAPVVQANEVVFREKKKDSKFLEVNWTKRQAYCGDEVALQAQTLDMPDGHELVCIYNAQKGGRLFDATGVELKGNRGYGTWITHRGPWVKQLSLELRAGSGQDEVRSGPLEIKAPEDIAKERVGPFLRETPQYSKSKSAERFEPTGRFYSWEVYFELELKGGELVVTRPVPFHLRNGAPPPTALQVALWKQEIERVWDGKLFFHRVFCMRGERCGCTLGNRCCKVALRVVADLGAARGGVKPVDLFAGACNPNGWGVIDQWWYSHTWWTKRDGVGGNVRAHEFGHLIGMYDEYPEGACDPARKYTDERGSIMNNGYEVHERHIAEFQSWLEKKLKSSLGPIYPQKI